MRLALQHDRLAQADIWLARPVDLIEQFDEPLPRDLRQRLDHGPAQDLPMANQLVVGRIHHLEDVLRAAEHHDEARGLVKQFPQVFALVGQLPLGQHLAGRLGHGAKEAGNLTGIVVGRRIGKTEPGILAITATLHGNKEVFVPARRAGQSFVDDRPDLLPDVGPHLRERAPERTRVLVAEDRRVSIVV